ncbi:TetR/AcrR family transcriptional regulator [Paenibacillus glycanilyticus]|uniref:TetR family transcriptional regulator n=1 Tax=Paenibacillus glycanilyticus TaxID=126569 RepID=A0ABQ6G5D6_9BACL|nr:TetR/AcrR family transcriptional regulator [Paenibacillus glycanilyticus]GLX66169.1 TetR family transcriptional regulator [Paenibacillus glycanilyticus]
MSTTDRPYHHGDLRDTLIRTAMELIAKVGLNGFSVAKVAKHAGVSSGAPYRHFPDKESLLSATGIVFLTGLTSRINAAVQATGNPVDRLAAVAAAIASYMIDHNVGFELFSSLRGSSYTEFHEQSRKMMDMLLAIVQEADPNASWEKVVELMEALLAVSTGYANLYNQSIYSDRKVTQAEFAERAATTMRYLIMGRKMK